MLLILGKSYDFFCAKLKSTGIEDAFYADLKKIKHKNRFLKASLFLNKCE